MQQPNIPSWLSAGFTNLFNQGQATSQIPYTPYPGAQVAPLSGEQMAGIQQIGNFAGAAQPWYGQAGQMAQNVGAVGQGFQTGGPSFGSAEFAQYGNPFTSAVTESTLAELNRQLAIGQQGIAGNAAMSGAWGGDRAAIAQSELARNAAQLGAQTAGQLGLQNWLQSQAEFNTEQNRLLAQKESGAGLMGAAAGQLAGIGAGVQGAGLQGAQALLGAGGLEQQNAQANLTTAYNNFLAQRNWPFQQLQTLEGAIAGVPTNAFVGQSTSYPGPSAISQLAGLGIAGAGIYNLAGQPSLSGLFSGLGGGGGGGVFGGYGGSAGPIGYAGYTFGPFHKEGGIVGRRDGGGVGGPGKYGPGGGIMDELKRFSGSTSVTTGGVGSGFNPLQLIGPIISLASMLKDGGGVDHLRKGGIGSLGIPGTPTTNMAMPGQVSRSLRYAPKTSTADLGMASHMPKIPAGLGAHIGSVSAPKFRPAFRAIQTGSGGINLRPRPLGYFAMGGLAGWAPGYQDGGTESSYEGPQPQPQTPQRRPLPPQPQVDPRQRMMMAAQRAVQGAQPNPRQQLANRYATFDPFSVQYMTNMPRVPGAGGVSPMLAAQAMPAAPSLDFAGQGISGYQEGGDVPDDSEARAHEEYEREHGLGGPGSERVLEGGPPPTAMERAGEWGRGAWDWAAGQGILPSWQAFSGPSRMFGGPPAAAQPGEQAPPAAPLGGPAPTDQYPEHRAMLPPPSGRGIGAARPAPSVAQPQTPAESASGVATAANVQPDSLMQPGMARPFYQMPGYRPDWGMFMLNTGAHMMASPSHFPLQAAGQGLAAGAQGLQQERAAQATWALRNAQLQENTLYRQQMLQERYDALMQRSQDRALDRATREAYQREALGIRQQMVAIAGMNAQSNQLRAAEIGQAAQGRMDTAAANFQERALEGERRADPTGAITPAARARVDNSVLMNFPHSTAAQAIQATRNTPQPTPPKGADGKMDPALLTPGQVYRNTKGELGRWNGTSFDPVQ